MPVAGVDRIVLVEQIAVQDVLALLDVLLLPADDLALAGPAEIAARSGSTRPRCSTSLAGTMPRARHPAWGADGASRRRWRGWAGAADWLAGPGGGLGPTSPRTPCSPGWAAPMAAAPGCWPGSAPTRRTRSMSLLNAALAHEARHPPGLQGFVHWLRAAAPRSSARPRPPAIRLIRIMTVHGAKGLQAPIVILPDTTGKTRADLGLRWMPGGNHPIPVWFAAPAAPSHAGAAADALLPTT